jgi:hypothetical protein
VGRPLYWPSLQSRLNPRLAQATDARADSFRVTRPPLDPARGAEAARQLRDLGVKGILIKAAELGYITEVTCGMPKCFCPEELGGARYFEHVSTKGDWSPTNEHFPLAKRDGGRKTPDNSVLAHRLCNRLDFSPSHRAVAQERSRENQKGSRGSHLLVRSQRTCRVT